MAATTTSTNEKTMANRLSEDEIAAFEKVFKLSLEYMEKNYDREEPIVRFKTPKELEKEIAIPIGEEGVGFDAILPELENTLKFSVRTGHVRFFNQLWAGTDKAAVLGEWLTALTNTSMYTYEVSPVYTLMEIYLLDKIRKLVGWESGDGVFAPGGANCNLLGLLAARNHTIPHIKKGGRQSWGTVCALHLHTQPLHRETGRQCHGHRHE
ncbi:glutamate decarboxylase gad1 [Balamuthia mandrillaris]